MRNAFSSMIDSVMNHLIPSIKVRDVFKNYDRHISSAQGCIAKGNEK